MAFNVSYIYQILDRYSPSLAKINAASERFNKTLSKMSTKASGFADRMDRTADKMANFRNTAIVAAGATGLGFMVKKLTEYEDAFADVRRVTGMGEKDFKALTARLTKMGEDFGVSADKLAQIAFQGKKLGIMDKDLNTFVSTVFKAANAFDMTEAEAGRVFGSIKAKMGLSIDEVNQFADSINFLADSTSASGGNMISIIERLSGQFSQLEVPPKVGAGWAAFIDQLEVQPELAATRFEAMITTFRDPKKLSKIAKFVPNFPELITKDPSKAMEMLIKRLAKVPKATRGFKIQELFGGVAAKLVTKMTGRVELLDDAMQKAMGDKAIGSMDREFKNFLGRTSTMLKRAGVIATNIFAAFGETVKEDIQTLAKWGIKIAQAIGTWVKNNPKLARLAVIFIAGTVALGGLLVVFGTFLSVMAMATKGILLLRNVTLLWAAAQKIINFVMAMNPIGLIIIGIAALITGIILLINHWDTVKKFMLKVWKVINENPILDFITTYLMPFIGIPKLIIRNWGTIKSFFTKLWEWLKGTTIFKWISKLFGDDNELNINVTETSTGGTEATRNMAVQEARSRTVNANLGGRIEVSATGGAQVKKAEIYDENNGANMVMAM